MVESIRTLIVDDDGGVRFFLKETLERAGHVVLAAATGEQALEMLRETPFHLVVLDLVLGGRVDGHRVLDAVKWRWPETAVLILTGHGSLESAMAAIEKGVDSYLLKPVKADELMQAVEAALQRWGIGTLPQKAEDEDLVEYGPFCVNLNTYHVTQDEQPLELTLSEFKLLAHLMQHADRVISPQELVSIVREYECEDWSEAQQVIKWYIYRLRRKVEPDPSRPRYIVNVRGAGYTFEA